MEDMLVEEIVESTCAPPFWTNLKVDMDSHKVVAKRSAFSTFPSAPNKSDLKKKLCNLKNKSKINLILSYVNHI
jgi:hypothetical protein